MDWVHAELEVGLEWSVVRLSETEKKREKTHQRKGENGGSACKSVGWSSNWHCRTVEAFSFSSMHGVELGMAVALRKKGGMS